MEILFKDEVIVRIDNIYKEDKWIHGTFTAYEGYYKYKQFLDAVVCESGFNENEFDKELLNEHNWFIKTEKSLEKIWVPAIYYEDGDVSLKYRVD
ncbi:MAG: hypothetical protein GYA50_10090 [Eubacteriaceae bacterium]|nr:hypothetical protein [Eubacteriaceae bacterium]